MKLAPLTALLLAGCVIPLPIEEEAIEENFPPFALGQPVPAINQIFRYDPEVDPEVLTFTVQGVGDPNRDDRIFYRWYINYSQFNRAVVAFSPETGLGPEQRDQAITFTVRPCQELQVLESTSDDGTTPGFFTNKIEVIVADRAFVPSSEEPPDTNIPNQVLPENAESFRLVWFVEFENPCVTEP